MKVSPRRSPISSQTSARQRLGREHERVDGGDVALVARAAARSTPRWRARCAARGRRRARCARRRARSRSTRVPSWIVTPRRSTASARPRTRRAGWIAAQCGVYVAPSTSVAPSTLARLVGAEQPEVLRAEAPRRGARRPPPAPARAAPACAPGRSCRPCGSGSRCPRPRRPGRPRRRCRTSRAAARAAPWRDDERRDSRRARWGTAPRPSRRCARWRRSPRSAPRARRRAATGRRRRGSTRSTARCSRRRRWRRRPRWGPASGGRGRPTRSSGSVSHHSERPAVALLRAHRVQASR